jgi:hypothetical protein
MSVLDSISAAAPAVSRIIAIHLSVLFNGKQRIDTCQREC